MKNFFIIATALLCVTLTSSLSAQDFDESYTTESTSEQLDFENLVYANIRYPASASLAGVSGNVLVTYTLSPSGYILNLVATAMNEQHTIPATAEKITILGKAAEEIDPAMTESGELALQAESLMVLQRIRRLPAKSYEGTAVASHHEVLFRFVLEE